MNRRSKRKEARKKELKLQHDLCAQERAHTYPHSVYTQTIYTLNVAAQKFKKCVHMAE